MKYQVGGAVHASTFIGEFEADSPQEAIEKAYRKAHISVCHQCAESIQDPEPAELWAEDEDGNVTHETEASHPAEVAAPPGDCSCDAISEGRVVGKHTHECWLRVIKRLSVAAAEVAAPPGEQWVPVGERMPEHGVVVQVPGGVGYFTGKRWMSAVCAVRPIQWEVRCWAPLLPAPPKGTP